jgi:hypothetical protein
VAGNCLQTLKGRAMADPILIVIDKHRRARRLHVADLVDGDDAAACEAEISAWDCSPPHRLHSRDLAQCLDMSANGRPGMTVFMRMLAIC